MKKRSIMALFLTMALLIMSVTGCGNANKSQENESNPASESTVPESTVSGESSGQEETKASSGEKQKLEFWCLQIGEAVEAAYAEMIDEFNASQDKWEVEVVHLDSSQFDSNLSMAIAGDAMPDIVTLNTNMINYTSQGLILPLNDYFYNWDVADEIDADAVQLAANVGQGVLYGVPFSVNIDMNWYNKSMFAENNLEPPVTQKEFLKLCEEYASPEDNTYFFSLQGKKPGDFMFNWLFTWVDDGPSFFDENGKCRINSPEFVEALDAYVDIYRNGWTSADGVTNDYNAMMAEFFAGASMYIMQNSGSSPFSVENLGAENLGGIHPLENDESGHYYCSSGSQTFKICLFNKGEDVDYSGGLAFMEYMLQAENVSRITRALGAIPMNTKVHEEEWFLNQTGWSVVRDLLKDDNAIFIDTPYWLPDFATYRNGDLTPDFQAVCMGEMTSQELLDKLAGILDNAVANQ